MKVTVDRDRCVASGQCVLAAAAVFDQDENDGVVILLNENPSTDHYDAVRLAAQMCPASVIKVTEEDS
jgi:ferredoxin